MKLERVALRGFLSHQDTDWSPNGARLVSLVGPNGAGKSTLASDALTFALYGDGRGSADDVVRLGQTDASVLVEFAYNGARYRVTRGRTTKAGGKSYLELHVAAPDGSWTPLTRDTIRETEAAIVGLLRLDAAAFGTAVLLGQGRANAFAEATAGERKRILGQVLGLDVYVSAEARAREQARDLEAQLTVRRAELERLEATAGELEGELNQRAGAQGQVEQWQAAREDASARRTTIDGRLRELDVAIGSLASKESQLAAARADLDAIAEDWRAAHARGREAQATMERLEAMLADADEVTKAPAQLVEARRTLEVLVAAEADDRRLGSEIRERTAALQAASHDHAAALATYRADFAAARRRVDELTVQANALEPVVCERCGHHNVVDQAGIREQLGLARAEHANLEARGEPAAPAGLARQQAAIARLESRRRELAFEASALIEAQRGVNALVAIAARGEAIAAASSQRERELAAITAADTEKRRLEDRGKALRETVTTLEADLAGAEAIRAERGQLDDELGGIAAAISTLDGSILQLERAIAAADARIAQLREAEMAASVLRAELEAAELERSRLRKLVTAFGVGGIPARIIEGVLPELGAYANELLAELRPGMTLELRAQRAKKSGEGVVEALDLVVRDDVGERPLSMYSGGERMSVSLALAVGLSRLVARRAGARIETLICDEPDGLDAVARRAFGQALRVIAHRGELERCVLVSHHDDLAEFADEIYQVRKGETGSIVELVA